MRSKARRTLALKNPPTKKGKDESRENRYRSVSVPPKINDINKTEEQKAKIDITENIDSKKICAKKLKTPFTEEKDLYEQLINCTQSNLIEYCTTHNLCTTGSKQTLVDHISTYHSIE
jgi:hypothetical protein